jgi:hypothetical protein
LENWDGQIQFTTFHDIFFSIFQGNENGNVRVNTPHIVVCNIVIMPLAGAWPAGLALGPQSSK